MSDPHNINSQTNAQGHVPPEVGGVRLGPRVTSTLYALLVLSAVLALWAYRAPADLPLPLQTLAPWIFLLFVAVFAVYRFGLVRAGRYPAGKAFGQIGAGVLFFTFLLPQSRDRFLARPQGGEPQLVQLMNDRNPAVRALAVEVVRYRPDPAQYGHELARHLDDAEPAVREQAHTSLVRIAGEDLGPADNPHAVRAWRARFP